MRIVNVVRGSGFPVGYGMRVSSGPDGVKWDSTGEAYLTVSYRPAMNMRGDWSEGVGGGIRVKWAILADGRLSHS